MVDGSIISVVDDDESVRESLPDLLRELGFSARAFASAEEFLESDHLSQTKCLIRDIAMPGMSGFDLQRELVRRGQKVPIIFITANVGVNVRSDALGHGGVECLIKPFKDTALRDALDVAFHGK
jgi:FixJ family two-component response regulator